MAHLWKGNSNNMSTSKRMKKFSSSMSRGENGRKRGNGNVRKRRKGYLLFACNKIAICSNDRAISAPQLNYKFFALLPLFFLSS